MNLQFIKMVAFCIIGTGFSSNVTGLGKLTKFRESCILCETFCDSKSKMMLLYWLHVTENQQSIALSCHLLFLPRLCSCVFLLNKMHTNAIPVFVQLATLNYQNGCSGSLAERCLQKKAKLALHCYLHFSLFTLLLGLASSNEPLKRRGERPGTE